jgi:hypothetical protein
MSCHRRIGESGKRPCAGRSRSDWPGSQMGRRNVVNKHRRNKRRRHAKNGEEPDSKEEQLAARLEAWFAKRRGAWNSA